jgi:hypothetical protein
LIDNILLHYAKILDLQLFPMSISFFCKLLLLTQPSSKNWLCLNKLFANLFYIFCFDTDFFGNVYEAIN